MVPEHDGLGELPCDCGYSLYVVTVAGEGCWISSANPFNKRCTIVRRAILPRTLVSARSPIPTKTPLLTEGVCKLAMLKLLAKEISKVAFGIAGYMKAIGCAI